MTEKNFVSLRIKLISHAVSVQRIFSNDTGFSRPGRNRIRNDLKKYKKKTSTQHLVFQKKITEIFTLR